MTLPNLITVFRLLLVPVVIWALATGHDGAALAAFLAAGISDAADGIVARRFDQRSRLGTLLDPVADKLLLVATFLFLAFLGALPPWLAVLVVGRDAGILLGVAIARAAGRPMEIRPLFLSKANTAAQIALVALVLIERALEVGGGPARPLAVAVAAALTVASGAAYLVAWLRHMGGDRERNQRSG